MEYDYCVNDLIAMCHCKKCNMGVKKELKIRMTFKCMLTTLQNLYCPHCHNAYEISHASFTLMEEEVKNCGSEYII